MTLIKQPVVLVDICLHFRKLNNPTAFTVSKHTIIFVLMCSFAVSAIIAFLPQMNFNNYAFECRFFLFYRRLYVINLEIIYCVTFIATLVMWFVARISIQQCRLHCTNAVNQNQLKMLSVTTRAIVIDSMVHIIACAPLFMYLLVQSENKHLRSAENAMTHMIFPFSVLLLKSCVMPLARCWLTTQARFIVKLSYWSKLVQRSFLLSTTDSTPMDECVFSEPAHLCEHAENQTRHNNMSSQLQDTHSTSQQVGELSSFPASAHLVHRAQACHNCGFVELSSNDDVRTRVYSLPCATHPLQLIYAKQIRARNRCWTDPSRGTQAAAAQV